MVEHRDGSRLQNEARSSGPVSVVGVEDHLYVFSSERNVN